MDPTRWHVDPFSGADPGLGGVLRMIETPLSPEAALTALDGIAQTEIRTKFLAGTVAQNRLSYVTRSSFWGFPDVTTFAVRPHPNGAEIAILARLRFGKKDFDVNAKRVDAWIKAAGF